MKSDPPPRPIPSSATPCTATASNAAKASPAWATRIKGFGGFGALPHPAGVRVHHGIACFTTPRLLELRHVLHRAIHPKLSRRVRVHGDQHARELRTHLGAPGAPKSQEVALLRR